jgi:glycosyltransferase involved in cell wall biosynthesis
VTVVCQERRPERYDLGGARVVNPDIGRTLPVFVLDRYEGLEPRRVQDLSRAELERFVAINAAAVRELLPADLVLTNHLLLGGPVGAASGAPYTVKAHGSELEFSMRGNEALCAWARETLRSARRVVAGSAHIRDVIADVVGPGPHLDAVRIVPPGVDVDAFVPLPRDEALGRLLAEAERDPPNPGRAHERLPDPGNAARLERFLAGDEPTVVYVGKLSREKGVHLLVDAVRALGVRAVIVGFGPARDELEAQAHGARVLFTGPLEHRHLGPLWALGEASVVPSTFPEAFGMVAAEAAATGCPPVVARHSGLAEIAAGVERELPEALRPLVSFPIGDAEALRDRLARVLALGDADRARLRAGSRAAVLRSWSWDGVAARLLADR